MMGSWGRGEMSGWSRDGYKISISNSDSLYLYTDR